MHTIDIEDIMTQIRAEIKEKEYSEVELSFHDIALARIHGKDYGEFDIDELEYELKRCNEGWNNPMFFPFQSRNPLKIAVQKLIRKMSKCVFWPIINYQNSFNKDVVRFQNQIKYYIEDDMKQKQKYEDMLKNIVIESNEKIAAVSRSIMDIKWKQIDMLCKQSESEDDIVVCKICGHQGSRQSYEKKISECIFGGGVLERYVCPTCGVIFGPTKFSGLSQKEVDDDYQVHYYGYNEGSSFDKEIEAFYMLKPTKEGIYLNYGCGCWSNSIRKLREDGYHVYGYEKYAPETDNPYMITSKEEVAKMRFDGIFSNDVLEHFIDPIEELGFMKTLLMHPNAKMAHSTTCYIYKQEFTRFHTHFFTGISLQILCERIGLKDLACRDALKERDFVCHIFGVEEEVTNYMPLMQISERLSEAERKENYIILHAGGIMCGPYIEQGMGTYKLVVEMEFLDEIKNLSLNITAEQGKKKIQEFEIGKGMNELTYHLKQLEQKVEFVIKNENNEDVIIKNIGLYS